jgi:predicted small metal-binding protein
MKTFRCGDVVPDCASTFSGTEDEILGAVAVHARDDHGLTDISPELVASVRGAMRPAA